MAGNIDIIREDFDLYFNGKLIEFSNGEQILVRDNITYDSKQPDLYHTVQQGDTITFLPWKYYKNFATNPSRYWKYIADANNIINPLDLTSYVGKNLIIPDYQLMRLSE